MSMDLRQLCNVAGLRVRRGHVDGVQVSGVRQDSRKVRPGDLFVARVGQQMDGRVFIPTAVSAGAVAVLVSDADAVADPGVPLLECRNPMHGLALAAEAVAGMPSRAIDVVGVTGTNGKTTTVWLTAQMVREAGGRCATLGTLGYHFESDDVDGVLTTPLADEVSGYLARARDAGATHLSMEVSSHALDQGRVEGIRFAVAAFTNLTQDHLDYHGTMQAYGAAKTRLFSELGPASSVCNADDAFGAQLASLAFGRVLRVGRERPADLFIEDLATDRHGFRGRLVAPGGSWPFECPLVGLHNVDNVLLALGIVHALELPFERAVQALSRLSGVPGRLERCDGPEDDILVLVDYAHTPDALERALGAVRSYTEGAVTCVFGCGGERDPAKRPKMGAAVGRGATRALVTNDNPRSEDPARIAADILPGLEATGIAYEVELDRARAIERAIREARSGDVVLLAGKGHEPYQILPEGTRPFDDRVEARNALARRRGAPSHT